MSQTANNKFAQLDSCQRIHVEDLRIGDWITVTDQSWQYPTYVWCHVESHECPMDQPIEIWFRNCAFRMLKVAAISMPLILCKEFKGKHEVIDYRSVQLVRIPSDFVKAFKRASSADIDRDNTSKQKKRKKKSKKRKRND